ncbi:MAG: hypothetical protein R2860_01635 [Desulfobacterales bacterium]
MSNQIKTTLLLAVMTGVIMWVGKMLGGTGMMIALILAGGMNFFFLLVFRTKSSSKFTRPEATREEASLVYRMVEVWRSRPAHAQGLHHSPGRAQCLCHGPQPGKRRGGRYPRAPLRTMNPDELAGVLAHELGHVENGIFSSAPLPPPWLGPS